MFCLCDVWRRFWNLIQLLSGGLPCREVLFVISPHEGPWGFSNSRLKKFFWVWTHRSIDLFETFERLAPRTTKGLRWVRNSSCRRKHILRAAKTSDPAVFQDLLRLYDTFWVRMQFDAKKESSSSDPKLKDEEHLHTLWSCNYLQPDFQNPHQGLVRGSTSRTRVFALLQASLYCFAFHSNAEKSFVYETLWRWQVSKGTRFNLWVRVCASGAVFLENTKDQDYSPSKWCPRFRSVLEILQLLHIPEDSKTS